MDHKDRVALSTAIGFNAAEICRLVSGENDLTDKELREIYDALVEAAIWLANAQRSKDTAMMERKLGA